MIKENKYFRSLTVKPRMLPLSVTVLRCKSLHKTLEYFSKRNNWDITVEDDFLGFTVTDKGKSFIFLAEEATISHLLHELTHAAMRGLEYLNIKVKSSNQEILCYYLQFLFERLQYILDTDYMPPIQNAKITH